MPLITLKADIKMNNKQEMQKRLCCIFKCNKRNIVNLFGSNDIWNLCIYHVLLLIFVNFICEIGDLRFERKK